MVNPEDAGVVFHQPKARSEHMEHSEVHAELKAVVEALRTHAAQSNQLAERISKLIQDPVAPSGLVEVVDSESIQSLMKRAREAFPEYSQSTITALMNALKNNNINTVGDLREKMKKEGRPDRSWSLSPYWWRIPNVGKKQVEILMTIIERFQL